MGGRKVISAVVAIGGLALIGVWWLRSAAPGSSRGEADWALLDQYCVDCHNAAEFTGGVSFEGRHPEDVVADAELWERAVRKLGAGLMPPAGEPRPEPARVEGFVAWLTESIDAAAEADPNPGAPALHRLNRAEYANAIRDLLSLEVDTATLLPADDSREGFDNIADALSVSPAHMQAYVSAATKISRLAVGDPTTSPAIANYTAERGLSQAEHLEGFPLGTRGGLAAEHVFPLDAEYEITVRRGGSFFGLRAVGGDEPVEVTLDGERVRVIERGQPATFRLQVNAGEHSIAAAIVQQSRPVGVDDLFAVRAPSPGVTALSIMGPFDATGPGDTPSRRRIFVCRPASAADEPACAEQILASLGRRAFRRPLVPDGESMRTLLEFYGQGRALGDFETGIQHALARILVDPQFVFRFEHEPEDLAPGAVYRIDDFELASRLSFFLWSSIPDEALLNLAEQGRLADPAVLAEQVERMLADPKAEALVQNFARQWLGLRELETLRPVSPDYDVNLRESFERETELLFASVLEEDRSIVDLLTADYTFVDERLARHYGIPNIRGSRFRRVELGDPARHGLLGNGSILTVTSAPNRTSPVSRGAWVLENLLGVPPPSPPPGVETNLDQTGPLGPATRTVRERLERHRRDPSCAACHSIIDPIGFALENFDMVGQWRETDGGAAVDTTGELWDGTRLDGPESLRRALVDRQALFVEAVTEKLMTYALGRAVEYYDMPAVREVIEQAAAEDYRFSALARGIAASLPFRMRRKAETEAL